MAWIRLNVNARLQQARAEKLGCFTRVPTTSIESARIGSAVSEAGKKDWSPLGSQSYCKLGKYISSAVAKTKFVLISADKESGAFCAKHRTSEQMDTIWDK